MSIVFLLIAVALIVVGGLLTAISAALGVVGRNDLLEEAATKRKPHTHARHTRTQNHTRTHKESTDKRKPHTYIRTNHIYAQRKPYIHK